MFGSDVIRSRLLQTSELPEEVITDADDRSRFQRQIRALGVQGTRKLVVARCEAFVELGLCGRDHASLLVVVGLQEGSSHPTWVDEDTKKPTRIGQQRPAQCNNQRSSESLIILYMGQQNVKRLLYATSANSAPCTIPGCDLS